MYAPSEEDDHVKCVGDDFNICKHLSSDDQHRVPKVITRWPACSSPEVMAGRRRRSVVLLRTVLHAGVVSGDGCVV